MAPEAMIQIWLSSKIRNVQFCSDHAEKTGWSGKGAGTQSSWRFTAGRRLSVAPSAAHLLMYEHRRRSAWRGRRFRNCEGKPCVPALRPALGTKLTIRLHAKEALLPGNRKNVSQLGTDRKHPRLERTDFVAGAAVGADLVIGIADEADKELF